MRYLYQRFQWRPLRLLACTAMALVLLCITQAVPATVFDWDNYSGDGSFQTRSNWNPYPNPPNVPGAGDTAVFDGMLSGSGVGDNTVNVADGTAINDMQVIDAAIVDLTIGDGTTGSRFDLDQTSGNGLVVGDSSGDTATLNLLGGWLDTYDALIGGRASLNVVGGGSLWDSTDVLISGDTIANTAGVGLGLQAQITTWGSLDIGSNTGSGRAVVDGSGLGAGALWTVYGPVDVGPAGTSGFNFGSLTLQLGGRMQADTLDVHGTEDYGSTVTVKTGGDMSVDGLLQIGPYGKLELLDSNSTITTGDIDNNGGSLNWTGGTLHVADSELRIDNSTAADLDISSLTVGSGMALLVTEAKAASALSIGHSGTGSLSVQSGGVVECYNTRIGVFGGSHGTCTINGTGSVLDVTEDLTVGHQQNGVGRLEILAGGHTEGNSIYIGFANTADGTVIVDGSDSTLTSTSVLAVGGQITDDGVTPNTGGTGSLSVQNGASVDVHRTLIVFGGSSLALTTGGGGSGTSVIANNLWLEPGASFSDMPGSLVRVNQLTGFGDHPAFNGNLQIGHAAGLNGFGIHEVGTGQSLDVGQFFTVGYDAPAELAVNSGGDVESHRSFIGLETGSEGTVAVVGEGSSWTCGEDLYVGYEDQGTLFITESGLVSVAGTLTIDYNTDGDSHINMTANGSLALFGQADGSIVEFLDLIDGTDAINYWDNSISDWDNITNAMPCRDYKLKFFTSGDLDGYTMLSVRRAIPGDANNDGSVDVTDLGILATYYGTTGGALWCNADFNGDGDVDVTDLGILATNYGNTAAAAVPEPGMLALLASCGLILLCQGARHRKP